MRLQTLFSSAALALCCIQAHAADPGWCGTPEDMTAKLATEGQRSVGFADHVDDKGTRNGMIFTLNAERSVGYILRADKPMGQKAAQMCVYNRMANVRVYDARKPGPDPASLLAAPEAEAHRRCDALAAEGKFPKGSCISLNTALQRGERHKSRAMFQGASVTKQPDGTYRPIASLITISGNVTGSLQDYPDKPLMGVISSIFYSSLPDGATIINATLVNARYTEYGLSLLN